VLQAAPRPASPTIDLRVEEESDLDAEPDEPKNCTSTSVEYDRDLGRFRDLLELEVLGSSPVCGAARGEFDEGELGRGSAEDVEEILEGELVVGACETRR
jgi:hypothetical protein